MKKIIAVLLSIVLAGTLFAACGKADTDVQNTSTNKLSVVTTIFPIYDWVNQVLGEQAPNAEVTMLLDNGIDLHNYQPTADDIVKISNCDIFIYVGGESDEWAEDALANATNQKMVAINLMTFLGDNAKEEEVIEGMEAEEEEEPEGEEEVEYDEHVWLSLKNAQLFVKEIAAKLATVDSAHQAAYLDNAAAYNEQLSALDKQYQAAVDNAAVKTLVFGDRFPFRYMVDDYGLQYYAAFVGCSAETEASFETISFLAKKVDELGLNYVLTIEGTDHRIAQTVIENTTSKAQQILSLNSLQSVTAQGVQDGEGYLGVMQSNLEVLTQVLNN